MKIVNSPPPNYKEILKHFPDALFENGVLFTYGDTCYCKKITKDLIVHEETHTRQQTNPKKWWARYYIEPEFRLSQEIEAYHNQWVWIEKNIPDRNDRAKMLYHIATSLSGKLYGNLLTYSEAKNKVKNYDKKNN